MTSRRLGHDLILTLSRKHVDHCIDNIILLKQIINDSSFPLELILYITSIIWKFIFVTDPVLDHYLYYDDNKYREDMAAMSTLKLHDIVDAVSRWCKIKIIKSGPQYTFYIRFNNDIKWHVTPSDAIYITKSGVIEHTPFKVLFLKGDRALSPNRMYVMINTAAIDVIYPDLYTMITKEQPYLSKYYVKDEAMGIICYQFDKYNYKDYCDHTREVKRQIVILWLQYFGKQLSERGFYIEKSEALPPKPITLNDIISEDKSRNIVY